MKKISILFDLDGTISDPIEGVGSSLNYALEALGFGPCPEDEVARYIGPPLDESFPMITNCSDKNKIESFVRLYRQQYAIDGYLGNTIYPGVREALSDLAGKGVALGLCTYKKKEFAEKILKMFSIDSFFSCISGGKIGVKKSAQIKALLEEEKIDSSAIMVGDRAVDLLSAKKNGVRAAGVLWGYGSREELEAEAPEYLFSEPAELLRLAG